MNGGLNTTLNRVCTPSYPQIQEIRASEVNEAWEKVINKEARYRYVIDTATI